MKMKMKHLAFATIILGALTLSVTSCKKDTAPKDTRVQVTDSFMIPFRGAHYVFYSLKDGKVVELSDSATTKWDFALKFATLIFNSNASGPGQGGVIVKQGDYDAFAEAPASGYAYDTTSAKLAVNSIPYNDDAWYTYIPVGHKLIPKAGWFFVIKTAEGKYAKLEVTQVTYDGYDPDVDTYPDNIVYKFRYVYQTDGSRNLNF